MAAHKTHKKHASKKASTKRASRTATSEPSSREASGRPLWSGAISFGLLQIPVNVHSAEQKREEIHFHQLDKRDLEPIGYERVNKRTHKPVAWNDIVSGYEHGKGRYVVLSDEELEAARAPATQTIDISDFVEVADIDPLHFETPYFLAPGKRAEKPYALLRDALLKKKKAAIATFVLRSKQHLVALLPRRDVIVLEVMRFAHELRSPAKLASGASGASAKELAMAEHLIDAMSGKWDPEKYHDSYHDQVLAKIKEKIATGHISEPEAPAAPTPERDIGDLMTLLRESLRANENKAAPASAQRKKRASKKAA